MECTCASGLGNTGVPSCQAVFDVTKQLIFVPYFKDDGTINGIDLGGLNEIDQAYLDSRLRALDPDSRWYITPELKNVVDERGDDVQETFEDTTVAFIQEGPRTFTGITIGQSPVLKGQLDSFRCKVIGVYAVDKSGNLIGSNAREGFLDPVRLQEQTLSPKLVKGTDTTVQKVQIDFTVNQLEDDANLSYIGASNITGALLGANGLLDVVAEEATDISTTGFTVKLNTLFGGVLGKTPAEGLETADFSAYNVTDDSTVTLTSVTEGEDGEYVFVFPAATSADVIRISNKDSGDLTKGYDIETFTVTIP